MGSRRIEGSKTFVRVRFGARIRSDEGAVISNLDFVVVDIQPRVSENCVRYQLEPGLLPS